MLRKMFKLSMKVFRILVLLVILFLIVSVFYNKGGSSLKSSTLTPVMVPQVSSSTRYTIVIDAGSTGSRIHVFRLFHNDSDNDNKKFDIKLIDEDLVIKIKPGLSAYASEPKKAADSLKPLLDKALEIIPKNYHKSTKLTLKATAGLRLISEEKANEILSDIKVLFRHYPFILDDVSIMDGKFEGIYSWLTLNYALGNYETSAETSVCSLDLGGGSTQVTFVPTNKATVKSVSSSDLIKFDLDEISYLMFAKSFLGFGLMSARMNIFKLENTTNAKNELSSVCLPLNHESKWVQQNIEYNVTGPKKKELSSYTNCFEKVSTTLRNERFYAPVELGLKKIFAFSYFFDRLSAVKLLDSKGGSVKIGKIMEKAKQACDNPSSLSADGVDINDKEHHFLCMDLTFIYSLLTQGYRLPEEKEVNVHNQVNDMEISWALGAAFHLMNDN